MAIDYDYFVFACPPRVGTGWFLKAAQLSGFGSAHKDHAHAPFNDGRKADQFRVTLVRHPCDWLASCYAAIRNRDANMDQLGTLATLDVRHGFEPFIRGYLRGMEGWITKLYNDYTLEANSVLRIEDMPWAFVELMEALGVPDVMKRRCIGLAKQNVSESVPRWDERLRKEVIDAEQEVVESFEYY